MRSLITFSLSPETKKIVRITVVMHKEKEENGIIHIHHTHPTTHENNNYRNREVGILDSSFLDSDVFLQVSKLLWKRKKKLWRKNSCCIGIMFVLC